MVCEGKSYAGPHAYGTASYLRLVDVHGNIHCSFIIGKSHLVPLRSITIPRLEQSAVIMSVKIDNQLRRELDLPLDEGIFWCDSTSVIQLIRNTSKMFHTFVANRLSVIHDGSSPEQWRNVDSKSNHADDVSRGLTTDCLIESKRWLNGPDFLWKTEECCPKRIVVADLSNEHPDVKAEGRVLMASRQNALYPFIDHYSSWDRLKRGVAWLLRFKGYVSSKLHGEQGVNQRIVKGELSVEEILAAERAVLTAVQQEAFKHHFTRSSSSRSPLHKLCPVLVDGTLQAGGCPGNAHISEEAKRPIILPNKHHVTDIIIRKYHEELAHAGREHVLASTWQKFWIVKGRVAV